MRIPSRRSNTVSSLGPAVSCFRNPEQITSKPGSKKAQLAKAVLEIDTARRDEPVVVWPPRLKNPGLVGGEED